MFPKLGFAYYIKRYAKPNFIYRQAVGDEKKVIFEMHKQGKNGKTIAKATARSPSAISTAMRSMGLQPIVANKSGVRGITWDAFTGKWRVHRKGRFLTLDEAKKGLDATTR